MEEAAAARGVDVTVILDIIHVVEYVWKAAHAFHPAGSPELACWAWTRVGRILEGRARTVAASMRGAATVAGLSPDARKPVDTCADYLRKYAPYLHYDRYLAAGYPIATGVIEGACRYLVRDRMELTGARWRLAGAEAVLKLRALRASGDFDAYWEFHEAREYERNHAEHYADRTPPPVTEPPEPPSHHAFDGSSRSCHAARRHRGAVDAKEPHPYRIRSRRIRLATEPLLKCTPILETLAQAWQDRAARSLEYNPISRKPLTLQLILKRLARLVQVVVLREEVFNRCLSVRHPHGLANQQRLGPRILVAGDPILAEFCSASLPAESSPFQGAN